MNDGKSGPHNIKRRGERPSTAATTRSCKPELSIVVLVCAGAASFATLGWRGSFPDPSPAPVVNIVSRRSRSLRRTVARFGAVSCGSVRSRTSFTPTSSSRSARLSRRSIFSTLPRSARRYPPLVMGIRSVDVDALLPTFGDRAPRRVVAVFSLVFAALLMLAWLKGIASRTLAGSLGWPVGDAPSVTPRRTRRPRARSWPPRAARDRRGSHAPAPSRGRQPRCGDPARQRRLHGSGSDRDGRLGCRGVIGDRMECRTVCGRLGPSRRSSSSCFSVPALMDRPGREP